jgi:hypothetical protein
MSKIRRSLSFSNVVAVMALFFALGGSAYAVAAGKIDGAQIQAGSIPGNRLQAKAVGTNQLKPSSIGNAQLKGNAVATKQLQSGAVTGGKIKAGSITGSQVKAGSLGATQINQTTLTGISAANIHTVQYVTSTVGIQPESETGTSTTATCPTGMKVIGGGASVSNQKFGDALESTPTGERNGWTAIGYAFEPNVNLTVTAICTPVATTTG